MASKHGVTGTVSGKIIWNDDEHRERQGAHGLIGGEDVWVTRNTFRSIGEAMTWCRKVLDGEIKRPKWEPAGEIAGPHTEPYFDEARVVYEAWDEYRTWYTDTSRRTWHVESGDHIDLGVARDDGPKADSATSG